MEAKISHFLSLSFSLLLLSLSTAYTPKDNYLISCGSSSLATVDNRVFSGDSSSSGSSFLSSGKSISLTDPNPSPILYRTARVFTDASKYEFPIRKNGTHLVRLHFSPFNSQNYDLNTANFSVSCNGFKLLTNFGARNTVVMKEFILMVSDEKIEVLIEPNRNPGFAFLNAIEVFSAPNDLIFEYEAKFVGPNGMEEFKNLSTQILETVHRINVGGSKVTPFNDTLWRNWVPDEEFLVLKSAAKVATTTHPPSYEDGGASREIAPDNVYMTAQQMNRDNSTDSTFNITWDFPVNPSARYFVRLHFCDIVSPALNLLYFNIYLNGFLSYKDFDLSVLTVHTLASPYYVDLVVDSGDSGGLRVSVGPSDLTSPMRRNAILNGVEIMKMVNLVASEHLHKRNRMWVLVGSIVGGFALLCFLIAVVALLRLRGRRLKRKKIGAMKPPESAGWTPLRVYGGSSHGTVSNGSPNGYLGLKIPFVEIQSATKNFEEDLLIGSGGFGMVYKGVLRDNLKVAVKRAVKRGTPGSRQGQGLPEFQSEIAVLSKIRHRHLVSLVGFCEEQSEMILVYEYMEKGPLKNHLYSSGLPPLTWKQRLEICIGAARGLHYLHTGSAQGIIHRDIKSTNILLDENYVAKVADFGLSRPGPSLDEDETHVSTCVKGSFGYLDPEYFRRRQLTDKSDVYSFGVVLFEVLCARPAVDPLLAREQVNLAEWAMEWQKKGLLDQIVDPYLVGKIKPSSLKTFGDTAEKCVADYGVDRPTMGDVLWNLEYALQLQVTGRQSEAHEDSGTVEPELPPPPPRGLARAASSSVGTAGDNEEGSDITGSQVFSQLITNEGR